MGCTGSTEKKRLQSSLSQDPSLLLEPGAKEKLQISDSIVEDLLQKTKFSQQDILDWWHGFLADCPSGVLDKKKFVQVYQSQYPHGKAKTFCDHVFRTFNPEKRSRVIDFEHFMRAIDITINGTPDDKLGWAFTLYDINGDERISKNEMSTVIESIFDLLGKDKTGVNNPRKHADQIFLRIDMDHDDYISKKEFLMGCKADEQIRTILAPQF